MAKERTPLSYCLRMLRQSAKRRNLSFTLTLETFAEFCARTGYLEKRGRKPDSLTVDRIDRRGGYTPDNIRVLTFAENSIQGADNRPRWAVDSDPY